jgi:hypothetical protein
MSIAIKRLIAGGLLALAAALPLNALAGETLSRVVDFRVLKVGMSGSQPPMNTVNRDGALMGLDVDLARALASAMRVQLEIKRMPFGELMTALEEDKVDMVISGLAITPERTEMASFVGPYMVSGKSILTKDSVLSKISALEEANRDNLKLAALENSTSASFVSTPGRRFYHPGAPADRRAHRYRRQQGRPPVPQPGAELPGRIHQAGRNEETAREMVRGQFLDRRPALIIPNHVQLLQKGRGFSIPPFFLSSRW